MISDESGGGNQRASKIHLLFSPQGLKYVVLYSEAVKPERNIMRKWIVVYNEYDYTDMD